MINKYVRSCIQNTKKAMLDYFKKCLQQRLKNGIGSTTECETVDEMENRLMTANWSPWIDIENVLSPGCKAFKTKDIPGYHGMLDINRFTDDTVCHFRDFKNTGFLSLCMKTDQRERVDYKTFEEAYEAMKEFEKRAYEWENKDKVAEVIEGPKN